MFSRPYFQVHISLLIIERDEIYKHNKIYKQHETQGHKMKDL